MPRCPWRTPPRTRGRRRSRNRDGYRQSRWNFELAPAWAETVDIQRNPQDPKTDTFCFIGGLREFTSYLNEERSVLHEPVHFHGQAADGIDVEVAFQYHTGASEMYARPCSYSLQKIHCVHLKYPGSVVASSRFQS